MNITLTPVEGGFELSHPVLPAPLVLTTQVGTAFAQALVSDELTTPAFKTDKNVWAPQTREPLGLWVLEDGTIQIWIAGQSETLTLDECRALAAAVLLTSAEYQVGDELEMIHKLYGYSDATTTEEQFQAGEATPACTLDIGTVGTVVEVGLRKGTVAYRIQVGDHYTLLAEPSYFKRPDPIQTYRVTRDLACYTYDVVEVQARNPNQARELANKATVRGGFEITGIEGIEVMTETDDELNAGEGFRASTSHGITALPDGSFAGDDQAALDFVIEKAFAGSRRHQEALRLQLA